MFPPIAKSLDLVCQLARGVLWQRHDTKFGCLNESLYLLITFDVHGMASVIVPFVFSHYSCIYIF
jgi:hypothetical protein